MVSEETKAFVRSKQYLLYLIFFMGMVAVMDQYISTIKTTAIPLIVTEFGITEAEFSWWEAVYLAPTFLIFALNGLNDFIGRKWSILILMLLMGIPSLAIVYFTPSFHLFMVFYGMAMFATVSNMWTIPVSEEAPAEKRAKYVSIAYILGLIPLQAILPPVIIDVLGLHWKWMYGVMFLFLIPVFILWIFMKETQRYDTIRTERKEGKRKKHFYGLGVINRADVKYILFSAAIWICWLINSFLFFWAGHYFQVLNGYTLTQWSIVLLVTLIAAMIGGIIGGRIMDKIGRTKALIIGALGLAISLSVWGFVPRILLPVIAPLSGFFISFSYTWIVVYVPEVFPTERRGSCMGWTTTIARISYVVGPAFAAVMLTISTTMELFWIAAGAVMIFPILIVLAFNPYETKRQELEVIEGQRA
jgi:MFS family permease